MKLLQQLEKDFILANTPINIAEDIKSLDLEALIREKVYYLLVEQLFDVYLNLLYVVDISEKEVKNTVASDVVELSDKISFLILKRELVKVWFKNQYSK